MDSIYIKTSDLPEWLVDKYFKDRDLISIDDLYCKFEDLDADYDNLKEEFENYKKYVESNYKELSIAEQVD